MATRKVGRPTENPKSTMLRIRIDDETKRKLEVIESTKKISKSEIVRNGIDIQYNDLQT